MRAKLSTEDKSICHMESPVYAILRLKPEIAKIRTPDGSPLEERMTAMPSDAWAWAIAWVASGTSPMKCFAIRGSHSRPCWH